MRKENGCFEGKLTAVVRCAFTHLHIHAVEVIRISLKQGGEDAKLVVASVAEQMGDDILTASPVGGVLAVFIADLCGPLLEDHAVRGWVVEDAERDKAFWGGSGASGSESQQLERSGSAR
jgi:hypothetical protein